MPTKTPRERFEHDFQFDGVLQKYTRGHGGSIRNATDDDVIDFIETLLEEARQQGEAHGVQKGREEMKEKCVEKLKQREKILIKDHRNYDVKQVQYDIKAISSL